MVLLAGSCASVQHSHTCSHSVLRRLQPTARRYTCPATVVNTTQSSRGVVETPLAAAAIESADTAAPQPTAAAAAAAAEEITTSVTSATVTAVTAADDGPRLELTPMQSVAGQLLPGSAIGEWRDHSTSQGYVAKPWQQQQRWQQQTHNRSRSRQQHHHGGTAYQQQQQAGHDRPQQQQQQQQQQWWWWHVLNNSASSRAIAHSLAAASTPNVVLHVLQSAHADDASRGRPRLPNIRHLATACRVLVDLKRQQQQQQQRRQQQQRDDGSAQDAEISNLLQLIDDLLAEQLSHEVPAAAAAAADLVLAAAGAGDRRHSSSSSSAAAATAGPSPVLAAAAARCLSTVVYSWGRLQHKPPRALLMLVLEGFLMLLEQQQQQQQLGQSEVLQQQQQQQRSQGLQQRQQQHSGDCHQYLAGVEASDVYSSNPPGLPERSSTISTSSSSSSSSSTTGSSSTTSSSSSSSSLDQHYTQALSNLVWGLSKLGFTADKPYGSSSSTTATSQRWRQQQIVRLQQCQQQQRLWSRLAAVAIQQIHTGTAAAAASVIDISSICYGFAAGGYKDVALWGGLAPRVITHMDELMPQDLSQILWAYATVGVPHQGVFTAATPAAVQLMPGFTPQGLVNVLWAYQTLFRSVPEKLLAAATAECIKCSSSSSSSSGLGLVAFGPLNLSMLVWVYTKSRSISPALSAAISRSAIHLLDSFQPSDLCRLLGGLAVLKSLDNNLLHAAESRLLGWLESGSVDIQVVCQGVWAYASCNHPAGVTLLQPLLDLAAKRTRFLVRSGDATARLLSILTLLRYRDDGFVSLLAQTMVTAAAPLAAAAGAMRPAGAGDPPVVGSISATAAAAAAVPKGCLAATPAAAAAPVTVNHLARWDAKNLIGVAASLAKLGHTDESASDLLRVIIQGFVDRLPSAAAAAASGSSQRPKTLNKVDSTWQSDIGARVVPAAAAAVAGGGGGGFEVQYPFTDHTKVKMSDNGKISGGILASSILLLWCAAVCDMRKDIGLLLQLAAPVQHAVGSALSAKTLAQLVQVYLWAQTLGPTGEPLISALPKPLMDQALFFWQYELVPTTIHSSLHSEVLSELYAMKLRPTKEGITPDGMFSVDCMVKFKGCDVALEVMGAEHYSVNKCYNKIESCYNNVTSSKDDSALAEPLQDVDDIDKSGTRNDNVSNGRSNNRNNVKCEIEGLSVGGEGSSCGGSTEPRHVLLGPEVLRMRLLAARGYALATVSAFEWQNVRSRGGARGLLLQKLEQAVQRHQAAAAAAAASSQSGQQQQNKLRHKARRRHQPVDRGTAGSQESSSSSSSSSSPYARQQQQQQAADSVPAIQQQVAHLMKQQGRSPAVIKGRLKREQYWQQRTSTERQGQLLLNMAVPWTAAKSKKSTGSSSSSSSGRIITRGESDRGSDGPSSNSWLSANGIDISSGNSSSSSSSSVGDGALAGSTLDDSEFDIALDLDELLVDTSDAQAA